MTRPDFYDYNMSRYEVDDLLLATDGKCMICGEEEKSGRRLAIDHDHKTGKVRGLLCCECNMTLGWYEKEDGVDTPRRLEWLEKYSKIAFNYCFVPDVMFRN